MQAEHLQDFFGIGQQRLEFGKRGFRRGELDQFHLVELMLPDEASGVAPVRAGLGAETGGIGGVFDRQLPLFQRLVAVDVGNRHFGGRDQIEIPVLDLEQVFLEFRQLAGRRHRCRIDQHRRHDFGIAVLGGLQIEHEVDQGPFQPRGKT